MYKNKCFKIDFFIAHRGASAIGPENTIASMNLAKNHGSRWIEVDVRFSKDKKLIIFHDESLQRIVKLDELIYEKNYKDLKKYDVGSWFNQSFKNEKIPTLIEAIQFCNKFNINLNIEIKPHKDMDFLIGSKVQEIIDKYWVLDNMLLVSSFSDKSLSKINEYNKVKKMILLNGIPKKENILNNLNNYKYIGIDANFIDKIIVDFLISIGKKVLVFTVNDIVLARKLELWGVTSIFSDFPLEIIKKK